MRVQITKKADGSCVLRCVRDDGSVTWQKQTERQAAFFALHDLTHFAVETALGYRRGFFGLIAEGWEIEDTTGKGARGPLPPEAGEVESIVGSFDAERAGGEIWTVDEFNEFAAMKGTRELSFDEIVRVKKKRSELFQQWSAVPPGASSSFSLRWPWLGDKLGRWQRRTHSCVPCRDSSDICGIMAASMATTSLSRLDRLTAPYDRERLEESGS